MYPELWGWPLWRVPIWKINSIKFNYRATNKIKKKKKLVTELNKKFKKWFFNKQL